MSFNKAKIVATVGPACSEKDILLQMARAGVNVFRINFSHGTHEDHRQVIRRVREINAEHEMNLALLADLQGPKLRVGDMESGAVLEVGKTFIFTNKKITGNSERAYMTYKNFPMDVKVGERVLLDDGKLMLEVTKTNGLDEVETRVIQGGPIRSKKGVNLPNTRISLPCLTEKDLADLEVALDEGVEWIGLSFVREAQDVLELKKIIEDRESPSRVVAKIEKPEAVVDIDAILEATDAVMVARGDLGVEVPMQGVPLIQKMIVEKCHKMARPVIIATQMMESMIDNLTPTRAEVSDVANSVLDGADAVMLSGETSVGKYPVEVVKTMAKIINHVEETAIIHPREENPPQYRTERFITDSICYNASKIADQVGAMAILTMTHSGYTALKIAAHRPRTNIVVFTANRNILNTISLIWGVRGYFYDSLVSTDETFADIKEMVKQKGIVRPGDLVVKIASMPIRELGTTNMLKISAID